LNPTLSAAPTKTKRSWRRVDDVAAGLCAGLVLWFGANLLGALDLIRVGPVVLFVVVMAGAVLCCVRGWQRVLWVAVSLVALTIAIIGYTPIVEAHARALVRSDAIPAAGVDAIVVLSGGPTFDNLLAPASLDRLLTGVELARRGVSRTLIVSDPSVRLSGRTSSAAGDVARIVGLVEGLRIIPTPDVRTTRDEAAATRAIAQQNGMHHVVVVTSPVHTTRACRTFERVGLTVTCVPAVDRGVSLTAPSSPWGRLELFRQWMHERVGMLVGR
jgi:uncharacterized SAM-binding protein YcdF (DUF218 family)